MNWRKLLAEPQDDKKVDTLGILALAALMANFVLIVTTSGTGAFLTMFVALPVCILVAMRWRALKAQDNSFAVLFGTAFAIFAVFIVLPGRPPGSAIYIFDFIPLLLAVGLYLALVRIDRGLLIAVFGYGCLIGATLALAVGAFQVFVLGQGRANGFGGSAIYYANISLLLGFLALAPLFATHGWRWPFAAAPFLGVAAALLSGSRSTITVGAVLAVIFFVHLLIHGRKGRLAVSWPMIVLLAIAGALIALFVLGLSDTRQIQRIADTFDHGVALLHGRNIGDRSMALRFDFYTAGIAAFLEAPFEGYGWHNSFIAATPFMEFYNPERDGVPTVRHLHNDVLNFAVSFGIAGVVAYLVALTAPVITWVRNGARSAGPGSYAAFAVTAAYATMGLTDTNFVYEAPKVMFCFTAAGAAALAARRSPR